ncbi:2-dehydro-3-deoxygalactonokinase [Olivibacter sp. SDN3]|uniref:2-dehydro-3-deoxygalactonokinase n=1 Tax=Olivibacter sp. SDN3 TaxID=2764720 RepID=UPI0016511434|nr:2-dehydro-3-deoxygalactonokinase [Olivibacter sp. SDN3]QNL50923.1 2-dehydro-3-deoxygalactonokinase [Olivibacter sp. SDN3]
MSKKILFISCDWGTTNFRLRVIGTEDLEVLGEEASDWGIQRINIQWKKTSKSEKNREKFFCDVLIKHLDALSKKLKLALYDVPILVSGMASANIGFKPIDYKPLPFNMNGSNLLIDHFSYGQLKGLVISGVCTDTDVIRGEETQLMGAFDTLTNRDGFHCFIIPGTHSKHIFVEQQEAISFKTYLTGEFFELLSTKSILQHSLKTAETFKHLSHQSSFQKGVKHGLHRNFLHEVFQVRTADIFQKHTKEENYFYLSGLVIGTELKDLLQVQPSCQYHLVTSSALAPYYGLALQELNITYTLHHSEKALIKGHYQMYQQYYQNSF